MPAPPAGIFVCAGPGLAELAAGTSVSSRSRKMREIAGNCVKLRDLSSFFLHRSSVKFPF